jgi:hypothetical protein
MAGLKTKPPMLFFNIGGSFVYFVPFRGCD